MATCKLSDGIGRWLKKNYGDTDKQNYHIRLFIIRIDQPAAEIYPDLKKKILKIFGNRDHVKHWPGFFFLEYNTGYKTELAREVEEELNKSMRKAISELYDKKQMVPSPEREQDKISVMVQRACRYTSCNILQQITTKDLENKSQKTRHLR